MRICTPHCGLAPETTSGGETYERELLVRLGRRGVRLDVILARGKRHPEGVPNWTVHRFAIGRGLRWWVAPAAPRPGRALRPPGPSRRPLPRRSEAAQEPAAAARRLRARRRRGAGRAAGDRRWRAAARGARAARARAGARRACRVHGI